jgi:hypothetical protein
VLAVLDSRTFVSASLGPIERLLESGNRAGLPDRD